MWRVMMMGIILGLMVSMVALAFRGGPTGTLKLAFRNSITGQAVVPTSVTIELVDTDSSKLIGLASVDQSGRAQRGLAPGNYRITVYSSESGALAAETQIDPKGNAPSELVFNLDPPQLPEGADPKVIKGWVRSDRFLATGFVVDDVTGQPVPGIEVETPLGSTKTSESGAFVAWLPLSGDPSLVIRGAEYGELSYHHFETWPSGDIQLRARIKRGGAPERIDLRKERRRADADPMEHVTCDSCTDSPQLPNPGPRGAAGPALPKSVRVGRNCATSTTCTSVEVYSLDTYTARVLSSEWYGCWGSVAGGMDAMRAGAVAVRSYGVSYVYSPRTSTYDICDTTSCQVFGSTTNANSTQGTADTTRYVLTTSSGAVARSEYSAENNNAGCGDGFTGTGTSAPCISDPVCAGFATNGHGRGLCQWGSARWATQKILSSSQACTSAAPATGQPRLDWVQILAHYYTTYNLVIGASIDLTSVTAVPSTLGQGGTTVLNYNFTSSAAVNNVWLIANLSLNGTGSAISNTPNDRRVNITSTAQTQTRNFATSTSIATGSYSVLASMLYDRDASNTVNTGDFLMADGTYANAVTITQSAVITVPNIQGPIGQSAPLTANLKRGDTNAPLVGKTVAFTIDGAAAGSAVTDATGTASVPYILPAPLGSSTLGASFSGDASNNPASGSATIWRVVTTSMSALDVTGRAGSTVQLVGALRDADGQPLSGKTVAFTVNGGSVGSAVTDSRGIARLNYAIAAGQAPSSLPYSAQFADQLPTVGSSDAARILVTRRP